MTILCISKGRGDMPRMRGQLRELELENQMLMQRLGHIQQHCTEQFAALHHSLMAAQQQAMRQRTQQILQVTKLSWRLEQRFDNYAYKRTLAGADAVVASWAQADAVICQAGCVSHQAYWLVGEMCSRRGEPCTVSNLALDVDGLRSNHAQEGERLMAKQAVPKRLSNRGK